MVCIVLNLLILKIFVEKLDFMERLCDNLYIGNKEGVDDIRFFLNLIIFVVFFFIYYGLNIWGCGLFEN